MDLVGRDDELAALGAAVDAAKEGGTPTLVVSGEAGSGKTTLVHWIVDRADSAGFVTAVGRADSVDAGVPYAPLRGALAPVLESELASGVQSRALAEVLERSADASPVPRTQLLELLRRAIGEWTAVRPFLLAVDDLHDADPDTGSAMLFLLRHLRASGALLITTVRTDVTSRRPQLAAAIERLSDHDEISSIRLAPFDREVLVQLASSRTGSEATPAQLDELERRSGGNPFYAVQLLSAPAAPGRTERPDDLVADDALASDITTALSTAVIERVAALGPPSMDIASIAAVLGTVGPDRIEVVAALAGLSSEDAVAGIDRLVAAEILDATGPPFVFAHPILRETIYHEIGPARRSDVHRRVAEALKPYVGSTVEIGEVAEHLRLAGGGVDHGAAALLIEAGDAAADRAPLSAARWYRAAIDRLGPGHHEIAATRLKLSATLRFTSHAKEGADIALQVVRSSGANAPDLRSLLIATESLRTVGRVDDALDLIGEASAAMTSPSSRLLLVRAQLELLREDLDAARRSVEAAQRIGIEPKHQVVVDRLLFQLENGACHYDAAARHVAAVHASLAASEGRWLVDSLLLLCGTTSYNGAPDEALGYARALEDTLAMPEWHAGWRAWALYRLGRWREVEHIGETSVAFDVERDARRFMSPVAPYVAMLCERGKVTLARRTLADSTPSAAFEFFGDWVRAVVESVDGRPAESGRILDAAISRERSRKRLNYLWLLLGARAEVALQDGDRRTAASAEAELWSLPRSSVAVGATVAALTTRAVVRTDASAAREAREVAVAHGLAPDAATALGRIGHIERDADLLLEAYAELDEIGAVVRQREVVQGLHDLGRRAPRKPRRAHELTAVERDLAELIAKGLTNREVARAMQLSPKTVETYLTRLYAKTGCRSRVELATSFDRGELTSD